MRFEIIGVWSSTVRETTIELSSTFTDSTLTSNEFPAPPPPAEGDLIRNRTSCGPEVENVSVSKDMFPCGTT